MATLIVTALKRLQVVIQLNFDISSSNEILTCIYKSFDNEYSSSKIDFLFVKIPYACPNSYISLVQFWQHTQSRQQVYTRRFFIYSFLKPTLCFIM